MLYSLRSIAKAGGPVLCTCILAANLVAAPGIPAPPTSVHPAVHLTASATPLNIDVPELFSHVEEFAGLVEPLVGLGGAPAQPAAAVAPAALGARTSIGIEIANALAWFPGLLFRAMADGTLSPLVTGTPVIGPLIGNIVFLTSAVGLGFAYAVGSVIMVIEGAIWNIVDAIGGAVSGIFRLPAAAAPSGAASVGALRTASAPVVEAETPAVASDKQSHEATSLLPDDDIVDIEAPDDEDAPDDTTTPEATAPTEAQDEPAGGPEELVFSEADEDEFLSDDADDETLTDETDVTTEPSAAHDEDDHDAESGNPAPASPSADSEPVDRNDAPNEI
jgi:hypothetical protein